MRLYWFAKAIASVALWSFLLWLDPFGLSTAADKGSKDLFQRIYSPHYVTDNQHRIFVVLFQDKDLPISGEGPSRWPPSYSDFVRLLDRLQGAPDLRPAAVFVDILFENVPTNSDEVQELCLAIERYRENEVPLVLAQLPDFAPYSSPDSAQGSLRIPAALQACTNELDLASVGWIADEGLYPLTVRLKDPERLEETLATTVASRLHEIAVSRGHADQGPSESDRMPFRILWGAEAPTVRGCSDYRGSTIEKIGHSVGIIWRGLAPDSSDRNKFWHPQRCAFHEVISPRDLLSLTPEEQRSFAALLADSYIFIGADVDGIPDFVDSPVHGRLPGVFIHAMAFDNMMTLGAAYLRDPPKLELFGGRIDFEWDIAIQTGLLLAFAIALALAGQRRSPAASDAARAEPITFVGVLVRDLRGVIFGIPALLVFTLVVVVVACYLFFGLHWTPPNYGGVLIASMGMIFTSRGGR